MNGLTIFNFWKHYSIDEIHSIDDVRHIFPNGLANEMNWCFLSTDGVHGTSVTLDDLEHPDDEMREWLEHEPMMITVLIIQPRLVCCLYGHFEIMKEEISYLRGLVASTLEAVGKSQEGNV